MVIAKFIAKYGQPERSPKTMNRCCKRVVRYLDIKKAEHNFGLYQKYGGSKPTLVEHPLTTIRSYREKWIRDKFQVEQKTLARLHQEGLTIRELSARFGVSTTSIKLKLYDLDRTGNKRN